MKNIAVNLSLSLIKHHSLHGLAALFYTPLFSALDGSEWSATRPGRFTPVIERSPRWIGG